MTNKADQNIDSGAIKLSTADQNIDNGASQSSKADNGAIKSSNSSNSSNSSKTSIFSQERKLSKEAKERKPERRIIMPNKKNQIDSKDLTIVPTLERLMSDALCIIGTELSQYGRKSKRGITLDLKEARAVQGYMETLVKLSRENREQARAEDLTSLSDEELLQLANQVVEKDKNTIKVESKDDDSF